MKEILRALGFAPAARPKPGEPLAWRRRNDKAEPTRPAPSPGSPFAALAALKDLPPPARRARRRRKSKAVREAQG
jgi:ATP-dependent RNA helicase SUPV3L1/SUV3